MQKLGIKAESEEFHSLLRAEIPLQALSVLRKMREKVKKSTNTNKNSDDTTTT